ncbi:MAG: glycerophosphodiester phosphodiesterase [Chloroflexi bacterium]|nr:MAG: hypothetical protein CUN54_07405 [Phototrophicales bacterium]RMF76329.1 MAG: glycerophosphodiester phosphodiesterase [Chloroflexota bacterium]
MTTLLEALKQDRTLIFGHRGASAYAPMNTIPAFELAAEQGADGIELDVHLTTDGEIVIVHDFTVDASTDGEGCVAEMSLAQLKALDAGSWFDDRFTGTRIPTLDDVFAAVGEKLYINIEIKSASLRSNGVEQAVAQKVAQFDMQERVLISSFNPFALRRFRKAAPEIPIGFLHHPNYYPRLRYALIGLKPQADHPFHEVIDEAYMNKARQRHQAVNTWTVNDTTRAIELRELGVNVVMTDYPDVIKTALSEYGA